MSSTTPTLTSEYTTSRVSVYCREDLVEEPEKYTKDLRQSDVQSNQPSAPKARVSESFWSPSEGRTKSGKVVTRHAKVIHQTEAEAKYSYELSPKSRLRRRLSVVTVLIGLVCTFILWVFTIAELSRRGESGAVDITSSQGTTRGSFRLGFDIIRLVTTTLHLGILCQALYWVLRSRRVGLLVAATWLVGAAALALISFAVDTHDIVHARQLCHDEDPGIQCTRGKYYFVIGGDCVVFLLDFLSALLMILFSNGLSASQHIDIGLWPALQDVYYFYVAVWCPAKNPVCIYCLNSVSAETRRFHQYYCEKNVTQCYFCHMDLRASEINDHEKICPSSEVVCTMCRHLVLYSHREDHVRDKCPARDVTCLHCGKTYPASAAHEATCREKPVPCPHCHRQIKQACKEQHASRECEDRPVECEDCHNKVLFRNRELHREVCAKVERVCPWCENKMPARQLKSHARQCPCALRTCALCLKDFKKPEHRFHQRQCAQEELDKLPHAVGLQLAAAGEDGGVITVLDVDPEGPSAESGLVRGDIILGVDGTAMATVGEFVEYVNSARIGSYLAIEAIHEGDMHMVQTLVGSSECDVQHLKYLYTLAHGKVSKQNKLFKEGIWDEPEGVDLKRAPSMANLASTHQAEPSVVVEDYILPDVPSTEEGSSEEDFPRLARRNSYNELGQAVEDRFTLSSLSKLTRASVFSSRGGTLPRKNSAILTEHWDI